MDSLSRFNRGMVDYNHIKDSEKTSGYILEQVRGGVTVRSVDLFIEGHYIVESLNPQKAKTKEELAQLLNLK
ncbi:hypothetical protein ACWHAM_20260 [Paenibacillus terrae]|uniref:Uncharacterized protein n=1 Tax=Paenibacillus terrae (strain HPL-003) TaxID=985665 RepID=G7VSD5_PAETH|nr:hypothetical protein [Paenibacillus terrae]AET62144.1 hypothetical protein HPL003_27160 [Paenibacillus terrae HPL-003]